MFNYGGTEILVTGGTGSIGREIVVQLLHKPIKKLVIFSRDEIRQFLMEEEINDPRVEFIIGDVKDYLSLQSAFDRHNFNIVFHAAAMKHLVVCENQPIECANTNIIGTNNIIRLCISRKVNRFVYLSTDKAASPTSVMGASKFIGERLTLNGDVLSKKGQHFCCVRFGNVANSRGSVIPIMVDRIRRSKNIWISDPEVTRFIMRISEAVRLVLGAAQITQGGEIFVLKMKSVKLGDLGQVMVKSIAPMLSKKILIERRTVTIGEKTHEDLINIMEFRYLKENKDMYMILHPKIYERKYVGFKNSQIENYDSSCCERINEKDLIEIICEYINLGVKLE